MHASFQMSVDIETKYNPLSLAIGLLLRCIISKVIFYGLHHFRRIIMIKNTVLETLDAGLYLGWSGDFIK